MEEARGHLFGEGYGGVCVSPTWFFVCFLVFCFALVGKCVGIDETTRLSSDIPMKCAYSTKRGRNPTKAVRRSVSGTLHSIPSPATQITYPPTENSQLGITSHQTRSNLATQRTTRNSTTRTARSVGTARIGALS